MSNVSKPLARSHAGSTGEGLNFVAAAVGAALVRHVVQWFTRPPERAHPPPVPAPTTTLTVNVTVATAPHLAPQRPWPPALIIPWSR